MSKKFLFVGLVLFFGVWFATSAQAQIENLNLSTPAEQKQLIKNVADKLESRLKGKSVGYAFVVTYRTNFSEARAGGSARRAPDANPRPMSVDDKFNIASASKMITAAAVMKLLTEKNIDVDTPVYTYLPPDWTLDETAKAITFRELLTHTSGIRCDDVKGYQVFYDQLKQCFEKGVKATDKVNRYQNTNFALFRVIIPRLINKNSIVLPNKAADSYAAVYKNYVQKNILEPAGLIGIDTKPIATNPALAYQFPSPQIAGTDFGDMTLTSASRGWNMSARELSTFISNLAFTEKILPATVREKMIKERLGVYPITLDRTQGKFFSEYGHAGYFPGKNNQTGGIANQGEMNTLIMAYSDGVTLSLIINSQLGPGLDPYTEARDTMLEIHNGK